MFENMPKTRFFPAMTSKDDLPISQKHQRDTVNNNNDDDASDKKNDNHLIGLRKRLSSFSVKIRPTSSASAEWAFRRTKSMTSITELAGGPLRRWWDWGLGWILSRRQAFARDIEMNEEETAILSCHSRGSWRHLFYKVRAEIRKLIGSNTLPTTHNFRAGSHLPETSSSFASCRSRVLVYHYSIQNLSDGQYFDFCEDPNWGVGDRQSLPDES
ncbi:uncharacterized protein LOC109726649 isoform X5 [Ananas comosus]|uniref:Uncharacterized protein LOC109726649 isoform X4 n=1 Tax=Ananas comosus TaxID=4615 RepID=A0A6P5H1S5_ANACO|nr:uncharacterized protein LOC109726649 isoform X4 [Ananas comosus]XP_020112028.1 uncharacterized protein LOC109726649 isoform X5 [Ananas comosus]